MMCVVPGRLIWSKAVDAKLIMILAAERWQVYSHGKDFFSSLNTLYTLLNKHWANAPPNHPIELQYQATR